MSKFYDGEQKTIQDQEALDFKTQPTREITIAIPQNMTSYYKIDEYNNNCQVIRIDDDKIQWGVLKLFKNRKEQRHITEEMNALLLPLVRYLDDDTKEVVKRALYLLDNLPYEEDN